VAYREYHSLSIAVAPVRLLQVLVLDVCRVAKIDLDGLVDFEQFRKAAVRASRARTNGVSKGYSRVLKVALRASRARAHKEGHVARCVLLRVACHTVR
jgi:hypothetical protein